MLAANNTDTQLHLSVYSAVARQTRSFCVFVCFMVVMRGASLCFGSSGISSAFWATHDRNYCLFVLVRVPLAHLQGKRYTMLSAESSPFVYTLI